MTDKRGKRINRGDMVRVDDPKRGDYLQQAFQGTVIEMNLTEGSVIVADQTDDCFEVDAANLEVE